MAKRYTAHEMREASLWFYYPPNSTGKAKRFDRIEIAAMLDQAADAMEREEREKRYEYGVSASYGVDVYGSLELLRRVARGNARLVRREVGEWEEVPNEE